MRQLRRGQRRRAGTVAVETAILVPVYMVLLFGVLFFGYSTLAKQHEQVAAHLVAMHPGEQRASDVAELFFPWNGEPGVEAVAVDGDATGSEVVVDDALVRVLEIQSEADVYSPDTHTPVGNPGGLGDTFDPPRVLEYLWVMAVGELINVIQMDLEGNVTSRVVDRRDYKAQYLQDEHVIDPAPPAAPTWNRRNAGAAFAMNNAQDRRWVNRRYARVEYEYTPPFFRHVYRREDDTASYLLLDNPQPAYVPTYTNESRIMTRGPGERANSVVHGPATVLNDMRLLLGEMSSMPAYMSDQAVDNLYSDGESAWVAK